MNFFQFFKNYSYFELLDGTIEVQANIHNIGIIINCNKLSSLKEYLSLCHNLVYLEINKKIIINNKYCESFNHLKIYRDIHTFHQNDDITKKYLYSYLEKFNDCEINNLILFGGEMYGFANLIAYNNLYAFSDFDSIIGDTVYNLDIIYSSIIIKKIDYATYNYSDYKINNDLSLIICNTSKSGLGKNMCHQINELSANYLVIISCNEKSFWRDYEILKNVYKLKEQLIINYVSIYLFEI